KLVLSFYSSTLSAVKGPGKITANWQGLGNPQPTDWIGLYKENTSLNPPTTPDTSYVDWMNLNSCSKTAGPNPPPSSGSCDFPITNSTPQGPYTVRLLRGSAPPFTRVATALIFLQPFISINSGPLSVGGE